MDTYEQKYKDALERARNLHKDAIDMGENIRAKQCEIIFPELVESEDEKIRKTLIDGFKRFDCSIWQGIDIKRILTWLEKQGTPAKLSEEEQNRFAKGVLSSCALSFINYLDAHKYEGKMCVSNGECEDIENAFHNAMWDRLHRYYCKFIEKQGEQKSAWSEEDEETLGWLCTFLTDYGHEFYEGNEGNVVDWLKSLRPQNTWKPSDELLDIFIKNATDFFESNFNPLTDGGVIGVFDDKEKMIEEFKEYMKEEGFNEEWI